jgi:hypothetical protein
MVMKLRYATDRKIAGSIPDEVTGFFNQPNFSTHCGPEVDQL